MKPWPPVFGNKLRDYDDDLGGANYFRPRSGAPGNGCSRPVMKAVEILFWLLVVLVTLWVL